MPVLKSRSFVFTWNNPDLDENTLADRLKTLPKVRYAVFQLEVGENGTPHYQGYIEFTQTVTWTALKNINPTLHIEIRRGTRQEARQYCMKEESRAQGHEPVEIGDWISGQGKRSDIHSASDAILQGELLRAVVSTYPAVYVKYSRGLEKLASYATIGPRDPPFVTLVFGSKLVVHSDIESANILFRL